MRSTAKGGQRMLPGLVVSSLVAKGREKKFRKNGIVSDARAK